jgi:hypothetical protein
MNQSNAPIGVRKVRPSVDLDATRAFLKQHIDPSKGCVELRILEGSIDPRTRQIVSHEVYKGTIAVWGDDVDQLLDELTRVDGISAYLVLNPVVPALKARGSKFAKARATATDADVVCLRWLFIDLDAKRPSGISSTDEEKDRAWERLQRVLNDHPEFGPSAKWGCSGNGYWLHILLPDYPNDDEHRGLIARVTDWFIEHYSDDTVEIDPACKNPARIGPLVGTRKCKGESTPDRPHRMVTMDSPPDRQLVPLDLEAWAALHAPAANPRANGQVPNPPTSFTRTATGGPVGDVEKRAIAYMAKIEGAVSGQRGHNKTFGAACRVGPGFDLSEDRAFQLIKDHYNPKCVPPWSDQDIRHKVVDAYKEAKSRGWLLRAARKRDRKATPSGGAAGDKRPEILISPEEHRNVAEAVAALRAEPMLFQRGAVLVTILADCKPKPRRHDPTRPPGSLRIAVLPGAQIRRLMTVHARWTKYQLRDGEYAIVPAHPPDTVVDQVATLATWEGIRPIEGITETPTLRPDGSLISTPGYDEETGLWFAPNGDFRPIPDRPTLADAQAAKDDLYGVVADFPFDKPERKATWLAALLTPMARWAIDGPCPLFLFDANCPGTGKTKLCDIIAILATGREMPRGAYPRDDEEMQKMLLSVAMAADRLILFDNVPTGFSVGGSALDRALTARTMKGRILGKSQMTPELPVDVVSYATGNNLGLRGDSLRRVVPCRLETAEERPEERKDFQIGKDCPCGCKGDLLAHVKRIRGKLVSAALTILRAYIVAGRPDQGLTPMDYPAWCGLVRNAVKWTTGVDPCEGRTELVANDEETNTAKGLITGWKALCQAQNKAALTVAAALDALESDKIGVHADLRAIFCAWSKDGKLPSSQSIGNRLNKIRGRNIDGNCLDCGFSAGIREWFVRPASKQPIGATGATGATVNPSAGKNSQRQPPPVGGPFFGVQRPEPVAPVAPVAPSACMGPDGIDFRIVDPAAF